MRFWREYGNHILDEWLDLRPSWLEVTVMLALIGMCVMSAYENSVGQNVGNPSQIQAARTNAQQELMALKNPNQ